MNLSMTIMAGRDAIGSLSGQNLVGLGLPISPSLLLKTGLEIPATAAAAEVVGPVWSHINKVFFANHLLHHIPHIFGNRITQGLSDQLTGILKGEFDLAFFIPV